MSAVSLVGSPASFASQLDELCSLVQIDEIMANSFIYDIDAQIHSYELLADVMQSRP